MVEPGCLCRGSASLPKRADCVEARAAPRELSVALCACWSGFFMYRRTSCGYVNPSAGAGSVPCVDEREAETSICSLVVADDADCCKMVDGTYGRTASGSL